MNDPRLDGFLPILSALNHIYASGVKYPRLRFEEPAIGRVHIKHGAKGASVTDGGPYGGDTFFGRIKPDGVFDPARAARGLDPDAKAALWALLKELRENTRGALAKRGRELGWCCVCGRPLSDPESVAAGIGPICAARFA